ncbi:MAG: cytochrome C biogenesis protein, partial [Armatimonadota bacterium]
NPTVGFLLFLALGLGLGTPYFVLGLFHDRLQSRLPRSGEWTILVERVFGILLLAVALFFASSLLPQQVYQWSWIVFWVGVALYLWFGERKEITQRSVVRLKQVLGMVFVWLALSNTYSLMKPKVEIVWEPYSDAKVVQAQRERKPVIIDFTATWCIACGELKEYTFTAPAVVKESARFVRLVVDATRESDPEVVRVTRQYEVVGLPTVIFIGSDGQERRALRLTGFEPARDFLKRMRQVQ